MLNKESAPQTEVVPKARRRQFSLPYKREVVRKADACSQPGEVGALLRREGLYSSLLAKWRRELQHLERTALAPKKRGPQPTPQAQELAALRKENAQLRARAEQAELLVDVQKKVSLLLGVTLAKPSEER